MSSQILERVEIQGGNIQFDNLKPQYNSATDNYIQVIQCSNISHDSQDNQNFSLQNQMQIYSNTSMNEHQAHELVNQNTQACQESGSESTNSIHLSNRQASPSNKQYYQQMTPPKQCHYQGDDISDSLNRSSNTKVNKGDDLAEFELLEQQVNNIEPESQKNEQDTYLNIQKCSSKDNIVSNNTDLTAQEILLAAKTPVSQQVVDKQIKMKPTLKKNYMSLEQLQMKCNMQNINNSTCTKNNDLYNVNYTDIKNSNQRDLSNIIKLNTVSDATDCSDIFNKYNLANSESIDQHTDSLQLLLERAFQSKLKYDQLNTNDQNVAQIMQKPTTPIQLEKQILSTLPPPSPINSISKQHGRENNNKIQIQFSNILDSLKKTNSSTTIGSHTTGSKSNSQQNCSIVHSKSGNKTPSSNQTTVLYQNDNYEKINVDDYYDPNCIKKKDQPNTKSLISLNKIYNEQININSQGSTSTQKQKSTNEKTLFVKSLSFANLQKVNQQRSISLSNAQDYAKALNRRRSSSKMSSKGSRESNEKGKSQQQQFSQEINKFFTHVENENEDLNNFAGSMSNNKSNSKSTSTLFRLNQDFERRRAIQQEQIKQKEMKNIKTIEESNKQNISRGKLSKDEEKNLVNKLFNDANRRQNIQVLQQKMKKIEEEQREQKSLEAQRESIMKRNNSNHNGSLYANVQSKIKSIINSKQSQAQNFEENITSNSLQRNQTMPIKHSYSKKNQNRTISPILKRTQNPLQKSDSQANLNKTQIALQQFQNNERFEEEQNNLIKNNMQMYHTKSTTFMDNLQFQFYTPSKPLINQNNTVTTITKNQNKDSEAPNNQKQQQLMNNSNNQKSSYLKQLSSSKYKLENQQNLSNQNNQFQINHQYSDHQSQLSNNVPSSVASIKKHFKNSKSTIRTSYENQNDQNNCTSKNNLSLSANKQQKQSNRSLSKKPQITINIDEEEEENFNQNNDSRNINLGNGFKNMSQLTPQSQNMMNFNQSTQNSCQNNNSTQNGQYVSMKCTNSFFREKNPSTLASTNQNFIKLNRQMQYKYMSNTGNQTSKNSSVNQSQQQSMKNSILFPCKTPNNQANNVNSNNKKSLFSFVNQSETSMDDIQFQQSRQSNLDTIKINLAQNKAQIVDNQLLSKKNSFFNDPSPQQKQEKVDEINKFISENPNFIQFMMQQYSLIQQNSQVNQYQSHQNNFYQGSQFYQHMQQYQSQNSNNFNDMSNNMMFNNQKQNILQNKILTVDDLLELDTLINYNNPSQVQSVNQIQVQQNPFPQYQQPSQKSQCQLISMSEIDQTPNIIQQQTHFGDGQQIQQNLKQFQPMLQQQQNQFSKQQMLNGILEDSYPFGSLQNIKANNITQNNNFQNKDVKNQQYQSISGNSLELQDNELIEQNFQSTNTLNPMFKSQNTIPSSNQFGNNISSNSTIEQHFSNLTYLQKSNQQFQQYN